MTCLSPVAFAATAIASDASSPSIVGGNSLHRVCVGARARNHRQGKLRRRPQPRTADTLEAQLQRGQSFLSGRTLNTIRETVSRCQPICGSDKACTLDPTVAVHHPQTGLRHATGTLEGGGGGMRHNWRRWRAVGPARYNLIDVGNHPLKSSTVQ